MPLTVAIVEDDSHLRELVENIIAKSPEFSSQGAYRSAEEFLEKFPRRPAEIVLMDIDLPGINGVECVRRLGQQGLLPQIIMLTVYKDTNSVFDALAAGALGYLLKPVRAAQLLDALRDVSAGGSPMSPSIARKIVQTFQSGEPKGRGETENLSPRELEVLELLARGFLYKEIAETLDVTYATIRTHVERIYQKLHVRSRGQAVRCYQNIEKGS